MKTLSPLALLLAICLPVLAACDSDEVFEDDTVAYTADLTALNGSGVDGAAALTISDEADLEFTDDDTFQAAITASGLDATVHPQHIHAEAVCPTMADDANNDGYVDVVEGVPAYGPILVPLDGQLTDASAQVGSFPEGATITYEEETDFDDFLAAYQVADSNPDDAVATLGANGDLDLAGRTIVLHGTTEDLPETVASLPGNPNEVTLPVACGTVELAAL